MLNQNSESPKSETNAAEANKYQLVCVVAMAENQVIGDGSDLIWHLPGDLKRVKQIKQVKQGNQGRINHV